eukprot:SAG11_NODE_1583_length_4644_cov_4.084708_1_plen_84_part_00
MGAAHHHAQTRRSRPQAEPALSKSEFRAFKIKEVEKLSSNSSRFRVELPTPQSELGMTTAGLLMVRGTDQDGKPTARPYTPIT